MASTSFKEEYKEGIIQVTMECIPLLCSSCFYLKKEGKQAFSEVISNPIGTSWKMHCHNYAGLAYCICEVVRLPHGNYIQLKFDEKITLFKGKPCLMK